MQLHTELTMKTYNLTRCGKLRLQMLAVLLLNCNNRAVGSSPGVGRLIDQSSHAAEGSEIEARCANHSARSAEIFFRLHFPLSGRALVALSYFEH